jgi:hypothetical protein
MENKQVLVLNAVTLEEVPPRFTFDHSHTQKEKNTKHGTPPFSVFVFCFKILLLQRRFFLFSIDLGSSVTIHFSSYVMAEKPEVEIGTGVQSSPVFSLFFEISLHLSLFFSLNMWRAF